MKSSQPTEIITFICIVWSVNHLVCADPCDTFMELFSASKRDPAYVIDAVPICDRLISPGWYRVKYRTMTTSPPQLNTCGTVFPIWLRGSNPETVGDAVTLTACQVGFYSTCDSAFTIQAKKCPNGDVVYNLRAPRYCNSAYCFEHTDACVQKAVPAAEVVYHGITWEEINLNNIKRYNPTIHFVCHFTPISDDSLFYNIEWMIENEFVKNYTVDKNTIDQLSFTTDDMLGVNKSMGEKIHCLVGAKKAEAGIACVYQSSTQFIVGFEVLNTTLTVQRGGSAQVLLKQNIPFVTYSIPTTTGLPYPSYLYIKTKYISTKRETACKSVGNHDICEIIVKGYHYYNRSMYDKPENWNKIHKLDISNRDPLDYYIKESRLVLRLGTDNSTTYHPFFTDVDFPDIHINRVEGDDGWKGKRCSSYADPHMKTFDGYCYECQRDGCITGTSYVLYENARHRQQVQVRHGSCWGKPRCVCAVSTRSGRDVFVIDFCDGREFINFPLCDDKSIQVFRGGDRTYRVFLPTGTSVKISIYESREWLTSTTSTTLWYINVEIYPTIADTNSTSGLCGFQDNNQTNDLRWKDGTESDISLYDYFKTHPNDFAKSWGLPSESPEDLLSHDEDNYDILEGLDTYTHKFCGCDPEIGLVCSYKKYQECKTATRGKPLTCTLRTSNRRKRDLRKLQERALLVKRVDRSQRRKRQTTISLEDATVTCTRAFETSAHYDLCLKNIPNFNNETLINCINDLVLTGDTNLTQLHLETALSQCKEYISYNSSLQTEQSEIVYNIVILCSNNCSNRGICNEGNCTCDPGFGGSDCSFDLSSPPTITHISDAGLCDRTTEVCDDIAIYGRYFVQNSDSACHMMRSEVNSNGTTSAEYSYQTPLIQRTLFEAECPLNYNTNNTWITEFVFNVTNDGSQFTDKFNVYVYQSACQIFNNDSGTIYFTLQEHYCYISGMCLQEGEIKNDTSCLQCDRKMNAYDWSNVCTTSTTIPTATSHQVQPITVETTMSQPRTSSISVSNEASETSTTLPVTSEATVRKIPTTTSMLFASESTDVTFPTTTKDTYVIVGASISSLVVVMVVIIAGVMLKQKFTKRESANLSTTDFKAYSQRSTVLGVKFDLTTNLFSLSSPDEMYYRPPSAASIEKGPAAVDLSTFYNSQHPDSLYTTKN